MALRTFQSALLIKKEERTKEQQFLVENVVELQKEAKAFIRKIDRLFIRQNEPGADLPIRPRPALPDLSALYELKVDLEPQIVVDARARLLDLQEQLLLILIKIGSCPLKSKRSKLAEHVPVRLMMRVVRFS